MRALIPNTSRAHSRARRPSIARANHPFARLVRRAGNKNSYFFAADDTVQDIKTQILTRQHHSMTKAKHLKKEERNKVDLTKDGEKLADEAMTLAASSIKAGDLLVFSLTEELLPYGKREMGEAK